MVDTADEKLYDLMHSLYENVEKNELVIKG